MTWPYQPNATEKIELGINGNVKLLHVLVHMHMNGWMETRGSYRILSLGRGNFKV